MRTKISEEREVSDLEVSLEGMEIAAVNMERMVKFYDTVFNASLAPFLLGNFTYYQGQVGSLYITLAPNEVLGIRAERSRYQLRFAVSNIEKAIALVKRAGGTQMQEISIDNADKYCDVIDPDGNSIELVEPLSQTAPY